MAYVRKKKTKGREYYQLVEGRRENGKVRQRVVAHLGDCPSVEKALKWWPGRILRLWHLAKPVRKGAEGTRKIMAENLDKREEGGARRSLVLRFMDEDGNMKRRKLVPHQLKDAYYRGEVLGWDWTLPGDLYLRWQAEYWHKMDWVAKLDRKASELEERYTRLCEITGRDPGEAQRDLKDRFTRLLEAHERVAKRRGEREDARREELRREMGLHVLDAAAKADPVLGLQAAIHGVQLPEE